MILPVAQSNDVKMRNKSYIITFNHMQRFYYLICYSNWCQNVGKLINPKGEISFSCDTQNVVYCKFDFDAWSRTGRWQKSSGRDNRPTRDMLFLKHPVFHFAPMFHFDPGVGVGGGWELYHMWHEKAFFISLPFVREIHRSSLDSRHKWPVVCNVSLLTAWTNSRTNIWVADDLRHRDAHAMSLLYKAASRVMSSSILLQKERNQI